MDRRDFIRYTGWGVAYSLFGSVGSVLVSCRKSMMHHMMQGVPVNVIEGSFDRPLTIPPVVGNSLQLTAQATQYSIFKNKISAVLGYQSNSILGPTIKLNSGSTFSANLQNQLSEPTNIHWHGLVIPASMDGHPKDVAQPGSSFNYNFGITQRAGMYWYHPHPDGFTAKQAFKGLAGVFVINDNEEQVLNLPSGNFEIPLVIQDKRIFPDYALDYSPEMDEIMTGYFGQYVVVNGGYAPFCNVNTRNYRVRILNGSNARIYNLALSNGDPFSVIGCDGGLLTSPQTTSSLLLGPGERADLIINFGAYAVGTDIFLISKTFTGASVQGTQEFRIMKFSVMQNDVDSFTLPTTLSTINVLPSTSATKTRTFAITDMGMNMNGGMGMGGGMNGGMTDGMGLHKINGKSYDVNRIDETVQAGATEIWVFDNTNGAEPHPMHIHGVQFQVIDRAGGRGALIPTEGGWKDTVMVLPGEKVRVIMTFSQNKGRFVLHCHNLEHEDSGMMLQFEIV